MATETQPQINADERRFTEEQIVDLAKRAYEHGRDAARIVADYNGFNLRWEELNQAQRHGYTELARFYIAELSAPICVDQRSSAVSKPSEQKAQS